MIFDRRPAGTSSISYSDLMKMENVTLNDVASIVTGLNDKVRLLRNEILALKNSNVRGPLGFKATRQTRPSLLSNANKCDAKVRHKHKDMQMQPSTAKQLLRYEKKQRIDREKHELDGETAVLTSNEASTVDGKRKKKIWLKLHGFKKLMSNRSVQNTMELTKSTSCTCLISGVHKEQVKCPKVRKKRISRGVQYVVSDDAYNGKGMTRELFNCFKRRWCVRRKSCENVEKVGTLRKKGSVEMIYKPTDKITSQQLGRQKLLQQRQQRRSSRKNVSNENDIDRTHSVERKTSSKRNEKDMIREKSKDDTSRDNIDEIRERMQSRIKFEAKGVTLNPNNEMSERPANNGHLKSVEGKYESRRKNLTSSVKESTDNVLADKKKSVSYESKIDSTNLKNRKGYSPKGMSRKSNKQFKDNLQELKTNSKSVLDDGSNVVKDKRKVKRMTGGGESRRSSSSKWVYDQ